VVGGSTVQVGGNSATINVGQYFKAAVRYGNGSTAYYVNGQQIVTTAAALAFTNTLNRIDLRGNAYYYSTPGAQEISTVATYTTGLTNAQLQELTTIRSGSGGNISYYGPYTIHTFTGSATFTPSFNGEVEVLVVAGGGGAAGWGNGGGMGGGGAGGLLYASSFGVSQGTGITVTIGAGGAGTTGTTQAGRTELKEVILEVVLLLVV
jgi:mucin-19